MFVVETPKDLLRNFYILLQAHTTRRPGPSFIKLLKKAGIEEIDPPTQDEVNAYRARVKKPSIANIGKEIASEEIASNILNVGATAIAAFAGGGLLNNVYHAVRTSRQLQVSIVIAVTGVAIDIARYATRENDDVTLQFISDSSWAFMVGSWIAFDLFGAVRERRAEERAAQLRRELIVNLHENDPLGNLEQVLQNAQQAALAEQAVAQPEMLDITTIDPSGYLSKELGEDIIDPITYIPFQEGDVVAVVKGNKQQPVLVNGLQSWIEAKYPLIATHPTTNETIETLADVKIYRLRRAVTGGKRKTKKQLKKFSKKEQNVRSLRKRSRRQIHKKR